ncbi:hypothetical protein FTUN_8193 [Frigoriglobus tundricola]|uniref:Uncharacterized protein n=1 Tax=Frigoriglobus tundricola TaxID=2774151 RepID=A0A6M5Z5M3_9BACT|nr:hypothetical protein FTUN_8193 [Frigoriglobus tundricola]
MRRVLLPVCLVLGFVIGCGSEPTKPAVLNTKTPGAGAVDAPKGDAPKGRTKGGKVAKSEGTTLDP